MCLGINNYSLKTLHQILKTLGEEKSAKNIATHIINSRPIKTTLQLSQVVINVKGQNKRKLLHPATKTFQALRIAVNKELERLTNLSHQYFFLINLLISFSIICISKPVDFNIA